MGASGFLERRARELASKPPEDVSGWRLLEKLGPLYTATTPAEAVRLMRGTKEAILVEDLENDNETWCDTHMIGKPMEGELTDIQKRRMLRRGEEEDGAKEKRWTHGVERKRIQARRRTRKRMRAKLLDDGPRGVKRARVSSPSQPVATRALPQGTEAGEEDSEGAEGQERQDWGAEACMETSTSDESDSLRLQSRRLVRARDVTDAEDETTMHDASDVDVKHADDVEASGDDRMPTKAPRKARRQHRRKGGRSLDRRILRIQDVLGDSFGAEVRQHEDDTELNTSICCACLAGPHEALFEHGRCHPELEIRLCVGCHSRYEDDMKNAETGEDGKDDYCQLCSYGGELLVCEDCPKAFCKTCIVLNLGARMYAKLTGTDDEWRCFCCDPSPLRGLQKHHEELSKAEATVLAEEAADMQASDMQTAKKAQQAHAMKTARRIEGAAESDDNTDAELVPSCSPGDGSKRKNIKAVLSDEDYGAMAKQVQKNEADRTKKLEKWATEREKAGKLDTDRAVINPRRPLEEPPVLMAPGLAAKLKPHQVEGVRFMWENVMWKNSAPKGDDEPQPEPGQGCILAHSMGLGKTLQVGALLHTMLTRLPKPAPKAPGEPHNAAQPADIRTALVIGPVNVLYNWHKELQHWYRLCQEKVNLFMFTEDQSNAKKRRKMLECWHAHGGIMLMGYEMYRNLVLETKQQEYKYSHRESKAFITTLQSPGPDVLVCDEAHILKNVKSGTTTALQGARTSKRVALTGSPLQNNLIEYYCMVNFVREGFLGSTGDFRNRFVNPICNGQMEDSTKQDVRTMKQRAHVLHRQLAGFVQRKGVDVLRRQLPPKYETVLAIRLSEIQRELCQTFISLRTGNSNLLKGHGQLLRVWNHPDLLLLQPLPTAPAAAADAVATSSHEGGVPADDERKEGFPETVPAIAVVPAAIPTFSVPFPSSHVDDSFAPAALETVRPSDPPLTSAEVSASAADAATTTAAPDGCLANGARGSASFISAVDAADASAVAEPPAPWWDPCGQWWADQGPDAVVERSGKLSVALGILFMASALNEKTLMFSQSLDMLNLLEKMMKNIGWVRDTDYLRIDGQVKGQKRQQIVEAFNNQADLSPRLMLISTKAGSLGINLVGASRVVLLDALWNPTHELQAVFRAYRFGQVRPVHVYRLMAAGTMEEKIYNRQVNKQGLAARVVDEHQVARAFRNDDVDNLWALEEDDFWKRQGQKEQGGGEQVKGCVPKAKVADGSSDDPIRLDDSDRENDSGWESDAEERSRTQRGEVKIVNKQKDAVLDYLQNEFPNWIVRSFEHDSLLQDIEEEQLDPEERKEAWEAYERATQPAPVLPPVHPFADASALAMNQLGSLPLNPVGRSPVRLEGLTTLPMSAVPWAMNVRPAPELNVRPAPELTLASLHGHVNSQPTRRITPQSFVRAPPAAAAAAPLERIHQTAEEIIATAKQKHANLTAKRSLMVAEIAATAKEIIATSKSVKAGAAAPSPALVPGNARTTPYSRFPTNDTGSASTHTGLLAPVRHPVGEPTPPSWTTPSSVPESNLQAENATLHLVPQLSSATPSVPYLSPPAVNAPPVRKPTQPPASVASTTAAAAAAVTRKELKAHVMKGYRVDCPKHGPGTVMKVFEEKPNDTRTPSINKFLVHYDPQDKPSFQEILTNTDLIERDICFSVPSVGPN